MKTRELASQLLSTFVMSKYARGCAVLVVATILGAVPRAGAQQQARPNAFPPPSRTIHVVSQQLTPPPAAREIPIAPLPPAAWTGMTALATLGLLGCRKAFKRFLIG